MSEHVDRVLVFNSLMASVPSDRFAEIVAGDPAGFQSLLVSVTGEVSSPDPSPHSHKRALALIDHTDSLILDDLFYVCQPPHILSVNIDGNIPEYVAVRLHLDTIINAIIDSHYYMLERDTWWGENYTEDWVDTLLASLRKDVRVLDSLIDDTHLRMSDDHIDMASEMMAAYKLISDAYDRLNDLRGNLTGESLASGPCTLGVA